MHILLILFFITAHALANINPQDVATAALARTEHSVRYDGRYIKIGYPLGDVPADIGVCTDVVIRAYRALGIDLQEKVHQDMKAHFNLYPKTWGLKKPDANIDHRRVLNLKVFFKRFGETLPISDNAEDYQPGDIVTWNVKPFWQPGKQPLPHIGIVVDKKSEDGKRYQVVHNIGRGPKLEDMLFEFPITGHYRYFPET